MRLFLSGVSQQDEPSCGAAARPHLNATDMTTRSREGYLKEALQFIGCARHPAALLPRQRDDVRAGGHNHVPAKERKPL